MRYNKKNRENWDINKKEKLKVIKNNIFSRSPQLHSSGWMCAYVGVCWGWLMGVILKNRIGTKCKEWVEIELKWNKTDL